MSVEPKLSDEYIEYLASEEWQTKRRGALLAARNRCQVCNAAKSLDVHHRTYERFGHEDLADLTVLCRPCHELFHQTKRQKQGKPKATKKDSPVKQQRNMLLQQRIDRVTQALMLGPATTEEVAELTGLKVGQAGTTLAAMRSQRLVARRKRNTNLPWRLQGRA